MTVADTAGNPQALKPMITNPRQIRAGRVLLDWHQDRLAEESGLSVHTIKLAEAGAKIRPSTAIAIELAFERAGLFFIDPDRNAGPGVRLQGPRSGD